MSGVRMKSGKVSGTGSAINISLGFRPVFVIVYNSTDGDVIDMLFASSTVDADTLAAATTPKVDTAVAIRGANGLSQYAGADGSAAKGFTIGSAVSESADVLYWVAFGTD
jgi:hypothetical protein